MTITRGVAVALLAAAVVVGVGPAASAAPTAPGPCAVKPTVVLVHGAWAGTSSWTGEIERLQRDGYKVRAFANPLRGLTGDAAAAAAFLGTIRGPVVLVGHSYGGSVITNAAAGNGNVRALVYVDAAAPAAGETTGQLSGKGSALAADPATLYDRVGGDLYLKEKVFLQSFAPDVPPETATTLWAGQRPAAMAAFTTKSAQEAWRSIPSWYVIGEADRIITPASQRAMAQRARAKIAVVPDGSHLTLVSHPQPVTDQILNAARATC
ncbi:alpha/beta hydrolase [Dactylosporangium fulvum]|uniref:Alpha/beta hydrolase n=1 Tax=Dactylosporangium fulvum TaxID=53359 RepID=A0ABY5VP47_9ACTN|nr:alpha/beta hydrolase [Dactylosporangium fulvum]UWP79507.1 alpha/beta hydrolase [Dactylosporangium fulvum]